MKKLLTLLLLSLLLAECRKDVDSINTDPGLTLIFSDVQILFDTVFTTVGTTTHRLRVYNQYNEAIEISSISITGNDKAYFRMNVDGISGQTVNNVRIAAKDSLYIFVDLTIDPLNETLPFLIEGSIQFSTNGSIQNVPILAYGQQAIFYTPNRFPKGLPPYRLIEMGENKDFVWQNDTPIVIYGYLVIDSTQHLTIEKGTKIYLHANSGIWVYRYGQISVNGTKDEPVVFQGDRLDDYKDIAGSWDRIWINEGAAGKDNTFEYAIIKNAFIGIQAEYNPFVGFKNGYSENRIVLTNTEIDNCKHSGIYATNCSVIGANVLVSDCGGSNFYVTGGGFYSFSNCTFANYWRGEPRSAPAVFLTNYYYDPVTNFYHEDTIVAQFENSIIYGDRDSEFNIESEVDPGDNINFTMDHVLLKTDIDVIKYGKYINSIFNPENENIFINSSAGNFVLQESSPAIDKGDPAVLTRYPIFLQTLQFDLIGKTRSDGKPDLGVYEK